MPLRWFSGPHIFSLFKLLINPQMFLTKKLGYSSVQPHQTPEVLQAADSDVTNTEPTAGGDATRYSTHQSDAGAGAEPPTLASPPDLESNNQASVVPLVSDASSRSQDPETTNSPKPQHHAQPSPEHHDESHVDSMMRQPETKHVSRQQMVVELKGIYETLVHQESKCIEVVPTVRGEQSDEQWQFLSEGHRALLQEHHDFFRGSYHPCGHAQMKRLASKYKMPARMWRHGMQSYLELLHSQLPQSREHMLTHIHLSWNILTALSEEVSSHAGIFAECLGDLARYGMAIDSDERAMWTGASRQWYVKASDLSPGTGRLYHHLAILARPNQLQQLFYYSKSLCVLDPFEQARESIRTLFEAEQYNEQDKQGIDLLFVQCHACMFMRTGEQHTQKFLSLLDDHIAQAADLFLQSAYAIGIANCCAMVEYGSKSNIILQVIDGEPDDIVVIGRDGSEESGDSIKSSQPTAEFVQARALAYNTARLMMNRLNDRNTWPFVHAMLVFVYHLTHFHEKGGMTHVEQDFPWSPLVKLLNTIRPSDSEHDSNSFPGHTQLAEDFAMRGLPWAEKYHPADWFAGAEVDDAECEFEMPSTSDGRVTLSDERRGRILWLGCRIAERKRWIRYSSEGDTFSVAPEFVDAG